MRAKVDTVGELVCAPMLAADLQSAARPRITNPGGALISPTVLKVDTVGEIGNGWGNGCSGWVRYPLHPLQNPLPAGGRNNLPTVSKVVSQTSEALRETSEVWRGQRGHK